MEVKPDIQLGIELWCSEEEVALFSYKAEELEDRSDSRSPYFSSWHHECNSCVMQSHSRDRHARNIRF